MYRNLFNLTGRVAVVTGGAKGIGLAISHALGEFGCKVVIATRNLDVAKTG
jgi:NAD(P)-dependent dehydrogenase (short-subunit alcohol dehydrogenase family)